MDIFAIDGNAIIAMIAKIKVQDSNQGLALAFKRNQIIDKLFVLNQRL